MVSRYGIRMGGVLCRSFVSCHIQSLLVDSFSADTLPTQSLVRGGHGATLLIHEATMGDDEEAMAKAKSHSTIGQAIQMGRKFVPSFSLDCLLSPRPNH